MRIRPAIAVSVLALALAWLACDGGASPPSSPSPSPTATSTAVASPTSPSGVCALDTDRMFQEIQAQASFVVYCPTFVPEGFVLTSIDFDATQVEPPATVPAGAGFFTAVFADKENDTKLFFQQGIMGGEWESSIVRLHTGEDSEDVPYADFETASYPGHEDEQLGLIPPAVLAHARDGSQQYIDGTGVDEDVVREVAAGMRAVPQGTPTPESSPTPSLTPTPTPAP